MRIGPTGKSVPTVDIWGQKGRGLLRGIETLPPQNLTQPYTCQKGRGLLRGIETCCFSRVH